MSRQLRILEYYVWGERCQVSCYLFGEPGVEFYVVVCGETYVELYGTVCRGTGVEL